MISSAVVIPEVEQAEIRPNSRDESRSPTLKRRFSENANTGENGDRKRPKVYPQSQGDSLNYDDERKSPVPAPTNTDRTPTSTSPSQPTRRAAPSKLEEKKRNQRLFGGILGVVSQRPASTNAAHKRRDEIEARQRERLKRENEEQEADRKRRKIERVERRKREQVKWEDEGRRLRHENMRHLAGFLKTTSVPVLYYRPWELREIEEEMIRSQKAEVEEQIRMELGLWERDESKTKPRPAQNGSPYEKASSLEGQHDEAVAPPESPDANLHDAALRHTDPGDTKPQPETDRADGASDEREHVHTTNSSGDAAPDTHEQRYDEPHKDDEDHHDGELVEGQEDDVIY